MTALTRHELLAAFRVAFDAGVEQGHDEATSFDWGSHPDKTRDKAFNELLETWNPDGNGIRTALNLAPEASS